jgi:hypothetical protein|tara:strand:+ start:619 stop:795 length:177 start_codon:yes stop_codon:yes gene_type:complete
MEGNIMIRFIVGMFLLIGCVGGLEQDTMGFTQFFLFASIGMALMIWSMPKLIAEGNNE